MAFCKEMFIRGKMTSPILNPMPDPQNPNDPMYQFIDTQPESPPPNNPDSSESHYTNRQFIPDDITATLPIVVTILAHGFQNGESIRATKFITVPVALATGMEQLNNRSFVVQQCTNDTFQLYYPSGVPVDGRNFTAYVQGGQFTLTGPTLPVVNPSHFPPPGTEQFS
jgi:hypothetical protein